MASVLVFLSLFVLPATASAHASSPVVARSAAQAAAAIAAGANDVVLPPGTFPWPETPVIAPLNIRGSGAGVTILDAQNTHRAFLIDGPSASLSISGVTIENGHTAASHTGVGDNDGGGAIVVKHGSLVVSDSELTDNSAVDVPGGAISTSQSNCGSVTVNRSSLHDNLGGGGGAVAFFAGCAAAQAATRQADPVNSNGATLSIDRTTFSHNTSETSGGGVFIGSGQAAITDSTFELGAAATGAGIANSGGEVALGNDTFAGNRGGDGLALSNNSGRVDLTNVTVDESGVALTPRGGTTTAVNSVLSATGGAGCSAHIVSLGHNVGTDASCGLTAAGDMQGVSARLGPLSNNGGGVLTEALLAGSPAIDRGNPSHCPGTDERGVPRPSNQPCDAGAYESALDVVVATPTPSPTPTPTPHGAVEAQVGFPSTGAPAATETNGVVVIGLIVPLLIVGVTALVALRRRPT